MQKPGSKTVLAVLDDLFFTVKIADSAKRAGLTAKFVKTEEDALEQAKELPLVIILDLNSNSVQPLKLIGKLKAANASKQTSLLGYVSHVQGELKMAAQEAGCDMVMARSAFSQNLLQILKRHSGAL